MALTTVANFKTWAAITTSDYDTELAPILVEAELFVAQALARADGGASRLETAGTDITDYYDGTGLCELYLRAYPIVSVTSVSYLSSVASGSASYTAFDTGTYYKDDKTGRLIRSGFIDFGFGTDEAVWPEGPANIKVIYQGGYTSSTVPGDILLAIYRVMALLLAARRGTKEAPTEEELVAAVMETAGHHRRQGP